jgi:hypothetical protein
MVEVFHTPLSTKAIAFLPKKDGTHARAKVSQRANGSDRQATMRKNSQAEAKTMMICNIPCRVGHDDLEKAICNMGFTGTYDFLHLPRRHGQADSNLGYGFINFVRPVDATNFALAFEGYRFGGKGGSRKACTVKVATCQGFNAGNRRMSRKIRLAQREKDSLA